MNSAIILFDGVCNLCESSVQFVIKRDSRQCFRFAALQSATGQRLMNDYDLQKYPDLSAVVLIENGKAYRKSAAALRIVRRLDGAWPLLAGFLILPRPLTDLVYDFIGHRRYRWFGKKSHCWVPDASLKKRFLD